MKKLNKILTCVAFALAILILVMALMLQEWITSLLITALLLDWWIIYKYEEIIKGYHKLAEKQCNELCEVYGKLSKLELEKEEAVAKFMDANSACDRLIPERDRLVEDIAKVDRDNAQLRKDLAEAKKREDIAHKTIESQRQEVCDLQSTVTALEAQLEAAQSQITTLKAKLSRKPRKPFPPQNVTPVKVEE
jgi:chromosome segregation ATPase